MTGYDREEPGLELHDWESVRASIEEDLADDPDAGLSQLADLVHRMLVESGYAIDDDVAGRGAELEVVARVPLGSRDRRARRARRGLSRRRRVRDRGPPRRVRGPRRRDGRRVAPARTGARSRPRTHLPRHRGDSVRLARSVGVARERPGHPARSASDPGGGACAPGRYDLRVAPGRRALMLVTRRRDGERKRALLLALHGAGSGGAPGGLYAFRSAWDVPGLVLVAPAAAGSAWTLDHATSTSSTARFNAPSRAAASIPLVWRSAASRLAPGSRCGSADEWLSLPLPHRALGRRLAALGPRREAARAHRARHEGLRHPDRGGWRCRARELRSEGYAVTYRRFPGGHRPQHGDPRDFVDASPRVLSRPRPAGRPRPASARRPAPR